MGSLAIQPPNGVTRSLTEVFIFLRNNNNKNQFFIEENKSDDKMRLIAFNDDQVMVTNKKNPPTWINVIDEINYEFTRIKSRIASLKELQNEHLSRPDFSEEKQKLPQQTKIRELTDEITTMFGHSRRLIRLIEDDADHSLDKVRQNVVSSLMLSLSNLMNDFRTSQSNYLRHLDTNLDSFLIKSSQTSDLNDIPLGEEFSIDQIQQVIENEHMTKERENEILRISKSIFEMNGLMKDIATMIVDQGAILDRIDYNCEQSASKINSALKSVEKAQKYQQKNKKMQLILILAAFAIFLMLLIIFTKL